MKKKILGIDVSSTTCGWCVLEIDDVTNDIVYLDSGFHKPLKTGSIIERIVHTRDTIENLIEKHQPDYIGIEDIIQFMKGASTAKTIIMLTTFNRMIGLCSFDFLKKSGKEKNLALFNVLSIRHAIKDKIFPKKEEIPELVAKHLNIKFPYLINKNKKIRVESYDVADGMAVALYYAMVLTNKLKKKKK